MLPPRLRVGFAVLTAGMLAVSPACHPPVTPAPLSTLLEHETWLTLRATYRGPTLADGGGIDTSPWQVTLSTDSSDGVCYSFEGEMLLDGEPLELVLEAHYSFTGLPPSDQCFGPIWELPTVVPELALSTLMARDESGEAFMTLPRMGVVRTPVLVAPEDGVLSYSGTFTVAWPVPEDLRVGIDAHLQTDAGIPFSTASDTIVGEGYDGGFEVFHLVSDGGEPLEGTLVLYGFSSPVLDCVPAELNCHAELAEEALQVPFRIE